MDDFPTELLENIVRYITTITDARILLCTSKKFKLMCNNIISETRKLYWKQYNKCTFSKYLDIYAVDIHGVEMFTVEHALDSYADLIPESYYVVKNNVICSMLAFVGKLDLLVKARKNSCPITFYSATCAAYNGHIDVLEYLKNDSTLDFHDTTNTEHIYINASLNGHINVLEWSRDNGINPTDKSFLNAIASNKCNVLQYAIDNGVILNHIYWERAVAHDQIDVLQWAKDHGFELNSHKCWGLAACNNCINVFQWLNNNSYYPVDNDNVYQNAAMFGCTTAFQWLNDHSYKLTNTNANINNIYETAAWNGYVSICQWLSDNSYKLTNIDAMYKSAAKNDHTNICQWLDDNSYKLTDSGIIYMNAATHGHTSICQWLSDNSYNLIDSAGIYEIAAIEGNVNICQWLSDNSYTLTDISGVYGLAAYNNHLDVFQWLNDSYELANIEKLCRDISHDILSWMLENNIFKNPIKCSKLKLDIIIKLMDHDLIIFDTYNFIHMVNDLDIIRQIYNKIVLTPKPTHHFIFGNNKALTIYEYSNTDINNDKQKLICYRSDGTISINDLNCINNCWWYLFIYYMNHKFYVAEWVCDEINKCASHKHCVSHIKL